MPDTLKRRLRDEHGFTLIELLVVITILGILAAVVVFSVGGVGDRGDESACQTDYATLQTAEEAHYAKEGTYASEEVLAGAPATPGGDPSPKFLSTKSKLHNITATDTTYEIIVPNPAPDGEADEKCRPFLPRP